MVDPGATGTAGSAAAGDAARSGEGRRQSRGSIRFCVSDEPSAPTEVARQSLVLPVVDLGRMEYRSAYRVQIEHHDEVLAAREGREARGGTRPGDEAGRILLVEHDPVVTIGRHPGAARHLLASPETLGHRGIAVEETDRGGDITYHGPGQLVCYPIVDLNLLRLGLHAYMRALEEAVIGTCARFGIRGQRDEKATGVWVPQEDGDGHRAGAPAAKICAMGVRVKRWITLHGLALNVTTNLEHFEAIVPCGLSGRSVTSMERELSVRGQACPSMEAVKEVLVDELRRVLLA